MAQQFQIIPSCHSLYSDIMWIAALFLSFVVIYFRFRSGIMSFFLLCVGVDHWYFHRDIYADIYHMVWLDVKLRCYVASVNVYLMICLCLLFCYTKSIRLHRHQIYANLEYESRVYNRKKTKSFFLCLKQKTERDFFIPEAYAKLRAYFFLLWFYFDFGIYFVFVWLISAQWANFHPLTFPPTPCILA